MSLVLNLDSAQVAQLQTYLSVSGYPEAYQYLADVVQSNPAVDQRLATWLADASKINADDGSFVSIFVREATIQAANNNGMTVTNELFQLASDDLAEAVLTRIVNEGGIRDIDFIISEDVASAVNSFGFGPEGWAGTLGAILPAYVGGLDLDSDSEFYSYLFKSFEQRGIDNFIEVTSLFYDVTENNLVGGTMFLVDWLTSPIIDYYQKVETIADDYLGAIAELKDSLLLVASKPLKDLITKYYSSIEEFLNIPGNEYLRDRLLGEFDDDLLLSLDGDVVALPNTPPAGTTDTDTGILDAIGAFLEAQVDRTLRSDPLVLDLDGDGIELIDVNDSNAFFDLDEDGFAERVGWIGGDDGMLAVDQNSNGQIDGMEEVFGNATTSGFVQLAPYDTNGDGLVDASDANFADLRIWKDVNEDGVTDAGELTSLAANNNILFQHALAA